MLRITLATSFSVFCLLACTGNPPAPPAVVPTATPVIVATPSPTHLPAPQRTADAHSIQALVLNWQAMGLEAEARFATSPESIEWHSVSCVLPADSKRADKVAGEAAAFAARAGLPARIELTARSRREDERLSRAIKAGALASGGRNKVKFDHVIAKDKTRRILVEVMDVH